MAIHLNVVTVKMSGEGSRKWPNEYHLLFDVRGEEWKLRLRTANLPKRLEVKAASGKKYNFSQIFDPESRRVVR